MTPYYSDALVTIYEGDCRQIVPLLDIRPDVAIADPPYGDTSLDWDRWPERWVGQAIPASTPSLWCFGSMRMFMDHADDFRFWKLAQDVVWEKHNGSGFIADRFKRVHDHAVQFYRGAWGDIYKKPVYTDDATARTIRRKKRPPHTGHIEAGHYVSEDGGPRLQRSVIYARSMHGKAQNETQKPEFIVRQLLEYSCPPGGLVLDLFSGSGTTARVAKDMGLRCVSVELREHQCEVAAKRCFEVGRVYQQALGV